MLKVWISGANGHLGQALGVSVRPNADHAGLARTHAALPLAAPDFTALLLGEAVCAPDYLMLVLVGVVANIFGQLGDLSMSLVKREAGIKDYSHLFLTHGGMLDRFDSTLFIAPVVWAAVCGGLL